VTFVQGEYHEITSAFREWGYGVRKREFGERVYAWTQWERQEGQGAAARMRAESRPCAGKLLVKDAIRDITSSRFLRGRKSST